MYITMSFMSKIWCHNAAEERICGPEPPKAKGPRVLASTNKRLNDLLQ